jgi:hypothetical protein
MNPFEDGLISAHCLHAVMTQALASRLTRRVGARRYPFFYNPMWGHFGDRTPGPAGTYFRAGGTSACFWNVFDQILVRPGLMAAITETATLDSDGQFLLVDAIGRPEASDHLPVFVALEL